MVKKSFPTSGADNDMKELDRFRKEYELKSSRYREELYEFMSRVMLMTIPIRKDKKRRDTIISKLGSTKKTSLTLIVMRYIVGSKGGNSRAADKWARVMNFLYDKEKIKPADFPAEITRRGGIEKLAREAAKAGRPPAKQQPANDNRPTSVELQIAPRLKDTLKKMTKGSKLKLIVTKESGKLIVQNVISMVSKTAASA